MEEPTRPAAYDGYTFANTNSRGGYGDLTTGLYDVKPLSQNSGYKSFGVLGQSESEDMSQVFDQADADRYMIISLIGVEVD